MFIFSWYIYNLNVLSISAINSWDITFTFKTEQTYCKNMHINICPMAKPQVNTKKRRRMWRHVNTPLHTHTHTERFHEALSRLHLFPSHKGRGLTSTGELDATRHDRSRWRKKARSWSAVECSDGRWRWKPRWSFWNVKNVQLWSGSVQFLSPNHEKVCFFKRQCEVHICGI